MALTQPKSMEELIYFTNRKYGDGKIRAWVFKKECPKCNKGIMGKPRDEKTGKPKIRAKEYVCPACNYTVEKEEYEDTLDVNIEYTCPKCKHEGELQTLFKRKKTQYFDEEDQKKKTVDAIPFECQGCKEKMFLTKKLKDIKR